MYMRMKIYVQILMYLHFVRKKEDKLLYFAVVAKGGVAILWTE